jgi:hypothetical protein
MEGFVLGSVRGFGVIAFSRRAGCRSVHRAQAATRAAAGVQLQQCKAPDLSIARWNVARPGVPRGYQPQRYARLESRVVIRNSKGETLMSKDYASPRGFNGYYVVNAKWSPDSKFFVYSMSSSGGHSPWQFPIAVYSSAKKVFGQFSDMIKGNPTLSADFKFTGPHTLVASTWKQAGSLDDKVPVTVDLEDAFGKLPASSD